MKNETKWELIHAYAREQAIADGLLVDVTGMAERIGFPFPVALTRAVWADCVEVSPAMPGMTDSDRVADILWMCRNCVTFDSVGGESVPFVVAIRIDHQPGEQPLETLKAALSYGEHDSPSITIMMSDED